MRVSDTRCRLFFTPWGGTYMRTMLGIGFTTPCHIENIFNRLPAPRGRTP